MKVDLSMFGSHLRRFRPSHMPHLKIKDLTILDFRHLTPVLALLVQRNNVQHGPSMMFWSIHIPFCHFS